jgi:signal transduction histidine kinase
MTPLHLAPELDWRQLEEVVAPLAAGDITAVNLRTTAIRKDGVEFPVEIHINHPPAAAIDTDRPFVAVVQDITDRVRIEAELAGTRAQARVDEERDRLARDLHDRVIGELFGAGLKLQATVGHASDSDQAHQLQELVTALDDIIALLRSTNETGAGAYLERVVDGFHDRLGHRPQLTTTGPIDQLPDHLIEELAVVIHEALTNVAKHARATTTTIEVDLQPDGTLSVTITDNGDGLPPRGAHRPGGRGTTNLARRAQDLGGRCTIQNAPTGGTVLTWAIPT